MGWAGRLQQASVFEALCMECGTLFTTLNIQQVPDAYLRQNQVKAKAL